MSISLVAGLGNPGRDYEKSRHNLGWVVLDALAAKHGLAWKPSARFEAELARWDFAPGRTRWLAKPLTFMNDSGRAVAALARFHKLDPAAIVAVYDKLSEANREKFASFPAGKMGVIAFKLVAS